MIFGIAGYVLISAIVAGVLSYLLGATQKDRDLACWLGLLWPLTVLVSVAVLAAALILVVFIGPAYLAANWGAK